jgi:hypothetical protein
MMLQNYTNLPSSPKKRPHFPGRQMLCRPLSHDIIKAVTVFLQQGVHFFVQIGMSLGEVLYLCRLERNEPKN